jgi:hypothetical protein
MNATIPDAHQREMLRVWSNPVAHAHANWWREDPPELLQAAARSASGRRMLRSLLVRRVPLPVLQSIEPVEPLAWATGATRRLNAVFDHAGYLLLCGWIKRAVARDDVKAMIAFVGQSHYENALRVEQELWLDQPFSPMLPYSAPTRALQATLRALGFAAIDQCLQKRSMALRGRVRLVVGPQPALQEAPGALRIDEAALLGEAVAWTAGYAP